MPILIIFWYCLSEKRRPRMRELFCAFFAIAGTALIATGGDFKSLAISEKALFWGLLSALACASIRWNRCASLRNTERPWW